jgi:hypothetical protein
VTNCEIGYVDQKVNENYNLDIFEIIVNISEPIKKLIHKKLLIFRRLSVFSNGGKCKNPFSPLLVFLLNKYWEVLIHK